MNFPPTRLLLLTNNMKDIDIQISGLSKLDKGYDRKKLKRDIIRYCGTAEGIKIPIWSDNGESFCGLTYTLLGSDKKPKAYIKIDIIDSSVVSLDFVANDGKWLTDQS